MDRPLVSVVVSTWDHSELLKGHIYSLNHRVKKESMDCLEYILVDDGSQDDTWEYIKYWRAESNGPKWKNSVRLHNNTGFAAAYNAGMKVATGKYLLILNNDTVFAGDLIEACLNKAKEIDGPYMMGPRMFTHDTGWNTLNGKIVPYIEFWCVWMSMEVAHSLDYCNEDTDRFLGIMDERFNPAFFEDCDVSLRAMLKGIKLVHTPDLPINHLGSRTTQRTPNFKFLQIAQQNQIKFRAKWAHLTGKEW